LAFRGFSGSCSLFIASSALKKYLDIHSGDYQVVDLSSLAAVPPKAPQQSASKKEVEKNEGMCVLM
jgi:hypothetical protein